MLRLRPLGHLSADKTGYNIACTPGEIKLKTPFFAKKTKAHRCGSPAETTHFPQAVQSFYTVFRAVRRLVFSNAANMIAAWTTTKTGRASMEIRSPAYPISGGTTMMPIMLAAP